MKTIDMKSLMYLKLFNQVTRINTQDCFTYNNTLYFCVPTNLLSRAVGDAGKNVKRLSEITKKRIRIIKLPRGISDAKNFINSLIDPIQVNEVTINDNEIIISGSTQTKATIIGRNKRRLVEMQKIIQDFFGKEFRVA